jgi:hypothetical protein
MGPLDLINHLFNFAAPAVFMGFFMALVAPWALRKGGGTRTFVVRAVVNSLVGVSAMAGGLWFFGNDGKMFSYLLLVLASAASQFWLIQDHR